ncbi:MAG: DUF1835 domain-containing protein [Myxococcota bacterium]
MTSHDTVHIRCGSDIREALQQAGVEGDFLEFSDPYCDGPVVDGAALLATRAQFIADSYGGTRAEVEAQLNRGYQELATAAERYRDVVLWFEHDSYDQLILARVLTEFARRRPAGALSIVCIDRFDGVEPFHGLGQLSSTALRSLHRVRAPVGDDLLELGTEVWAALCEPSPRSLHAIAESGTVALPIMAGALSRHLQELPWIDTGLSLTERLTLDALESGPVSAGSLFRTLTYELEPRPYLGDLMFWAVLSRLARGGAVEFSEGAWQDRTVTATALGHDARAGRRDYMQHGTAPVRHVGGVQVGGDTDGWRWSPGRSAPQRID